MNFRAALAEIWRATLLFMPKALGFIAILVIGYVVAKVLRRIVHRLLERFGFDRAVRRGGIARLLAGSRYDASEIVGMLAYYTVLLFTLQLAFGIWGPNPVSGLIAAVVAWLPKAIVAIVIVVVAAAIASAVKDIIASMLSSLDYGRLLANLAAVFIAGLGVIAALNQIGIATTVTLPVLITVLATVGGILIVGVGGGMIGPMQQRWERWLSKAEQESGPVRERIQAYATARRETMEAQEAARLEVENAPAVGSQPVDTTYAQGKAAVVGAAAAPLYGPPNPAPGQPNGWPAHSASAQAMPAPAQPTPAQAMPAPAQPAPAQAMPSAAQASPAQASPAQAEAGSQNGWPAWPAQDGQPAPGVPQPRSEDPHSPQSQAGQEPPAGQDNPPSSDAPTQPVRAGAQARRAGGHDTPTQILRPVDPDEPRGA